MTEEFRVVKDCEHFGNCPRQHIPGEFCSGDVAPNFRDTPDCPNFLCRSLEENLASFQIATAEVIKENFVLKDITLYNGKNIEVVAIKEDSRVAISTEVFESQNRAVVDESGQTYLPMTKIPEIYHPNKSLGRGIWPSEKMIPIVRQIISVLKGKD